MKNVVYVIEHCDDPFTNRWRVFAAAVSEEVAHKACDIAAKAHDQPRSEYRYTLITVLTGKEMGL
jgi:hypothetical protein